MFTLCLAAIVLLPYSKILTVKGFSKSFCVGLLESTTLRVVVLTRIRLHTLGSPQTHVSEITLGIVVGVVLFIMNKMGSTIKERIAKIT